MKVKYLILGGLALAMAAPLSAAPIVFNFNNIALSPNTTDGLNGFADSTAIKNNMNSVPGCSPNCVSSVTGALATANYNADGNGYPNAASPETLGTTDGATSYNDSTHNSSPPDEFIMNDDIFAGSHSITITFTSNLAVGTVVTFDWEVFADGNCGGCGVGSPDFPELDFYAGGVLQHIFLASVIPGYDPQGLGTASFTLTAATNTLRWDDWPPEIGMDNLGIAPPPLKTVPEPSPLALTGLALALLALLRWKAAGRTNARALT